MKTLERSLAIIVVIFMLVFVITKITGELSYFSAIYIIILLLVWILLKLDQIKDKL